MQRRYCDICTKEMSKKDMTRIIVDYKKGRVKISYEIIVAINDVWHGVDVCHHCIMETLKFSMPRMEKKQ